MGILLDVVLKMEVFGGVLRLNGFITVKFVFLDQFLLTTTWSMLNILEK